MKSTTRGWLIFLTILVLLLIWTAANDGEYAVLVRSFLRSLFRAIV